MFFQDKRLEAELCRRAIVERNRLVHRFFYFHAYDFISSAGKQTMLEEADRARMALENADFVTNASLYRLGERYGLTHQGVEEHLEHSMAEMRRKHESEGSDCSMRNRHYGSLSTVIYALLAFDHRMFARRTDQ
jgi:hypothetical protein